MQTLKFRGCTSKQNCTSDQIKTLFRIHESMGIFYQSIREN